MTANGPNSEDSSCWTSLQRKADKPVKPQGERRNMDAITYLKTYQKMCDSHTNCENCGMSHAETHCEDWAHEHPEQAVAIVEKWLSEHPPATYADKMREIFPEFDIDSVCLNDMIEKYIRCNPEGDCEACWNREYGSLED
jgi:hypothetical protein